MIYFPMTADILTPGHIYCLDYLSQRGTVMIGLLTDHALKGYKVPVMNTHDRYTIMETISNAYSNVFVTLQEDLDPTKNLEEFDYTHLASGDGFEAVERKAARKFGMELLDIPIPKSYSSSSVKKKIRNMV